MSHLLLVCKRIGLRIIAFGVFYSGALRFVNAIANRFKLNTREGKLVFPFLKRARSRTVQILIYHRVNDDGDPFFPATPTKAFSKQMEFLRGNYNVFTLKDAVDRMRSGDIPDNAIVITFDDGYRDNYIHAFPILKNLSIPATIFLTTNAIDSGSMLWHDRVFAAFRQTRMRLFEGLGNGSSTSYPLTTLEERLLAQSAVLRVLRAVDEDSRSQLIDVLARKLQVVNFRDDPDLMLTWDQVKEMSRHGISFGSHTLTHPILSTLPTGRLKAELYESKKIIEEKLGNAVAAFAYPNGKREDFNEATKAMVRQAGYRYALTTLFGSNGQGQDLFELRRATPWDEEIWSFGLRLSCYKFCA